MPTHFSRETQSNLMRFWKNVGHWSEIAGIFHNCVSLDQTLPGVRPSSGANLCVTWAINILLFLPPFLFSFFHLPLVLAPPMVPFLCLRVCTCTHTCSLCKWMSEQETFTHSSISHDSIFQGGSPDEPNQNRQQHRLLHPAPQHWITDSVDNNLWKCTFKQVLSWLLCTLKFENYVSLVLPCPWQNRSIW